MGRLGTIITSIVLLLAVVAAWLIWHLVPPSLAVPAQQDLVLSHVTVYNPGTAPIADQTIIITDGVIRDVRPTQPTDPVARCRDCIVMPGLIDMHVHTPPAFVAGNQDLFSLLYLRYGVTSVRDVGQSDSSVIDWANAVNAGDRAGPNISYCGPVLDGDPPGWPMALRVTDAEQARNLVGQIAGTGAQCIKIYNELTPSVFNAITEAAKNRGLPVIGHVPHSVGLQNSFDFEIQHMTGLPYLTRPRPPFGYDLDFADVLAMSDTEAAAALELIKQNGNHLTPTLANFSLRLSAADQDRFPPPAAMTMMPAFWQSVYPLIAGVPDGDEAIGLQADVAPVLRAQVGMAHQMGIDVLAGTDTLMPYVIPGDALWREISQLALAFGAFEPALIAATLVNGKHLVPHVADHTGNAGRGGDNAIGNRPVGRIATGMRADMLILREVPDADLAALNTIETVIVSGRIYDRSYLDESMAAFSNYFGSATYRFVFGAIASGAVTLMQSSNADAGD